MRQKMDRFCKDLLDSVDQSKHGRALFTLRKSAAARQLFARLQYDVAFPEIEEALRTERYTLLTSLKAISEEVAVRHIIKFGPFRPRLVLSASTYDFERLAEELDVPVEDNEWGDSHVRTIDGWWQV